MSESIHGASPDEIEIKVISTPLSEIKPIKKSRALRILDIEDLKEVVEPPLLKACQILYEKEIATYESSANREQIEFRYPYAALLTLNGDQLNLENKKIAQEMALGNTNGYKVKITDPSRYEPLYKTMIIFTVPMTDGITAEEIEEKSVNFANRFVLNVINIEVPDIEPEITIIE